MNSTTWRFDGNTASKWARLLSVGLLSYVLDVSLFQALFAAHLKTFPAHLASFSAAALLAYTLFARRTSFASSPLDAAPRPAILGRAVVVVLLALLLRCASLIQLVESWTWPPQVAIFLAAFVGQLSQSIGLGLIVFVPGSWLHPSPSRWQALTIAAVAYTVFLRLACMGSINLIPEEAYYWNYAQHLD